MSCTEQTEREVKLSAAANYDLPDLDGIIPGLVAVARGERELRATYYDSADVRQTRAGITVRHRSGESEPGLGEWTVKLPDRNGAPGHLTRPAGEIKPDARAIAAGPRRVRLKQRRLPTVESG